MTRESWYALAYVVRALEARIAYRRRFYVGGKTWQDDEDERLVAELNRVLREEGWKP